MHACKCRLRAQLKPTPVSGPGTKSINLQTLQHMLMERFAPDDISLIEVTRIVNEAFLFTQHKRMLKDGVKYTYIVGIDMATQPCAQSAPPATDEKQQLLRRIQELEQQVEELKSCKQLIDESEKVLAVAVSSSSGPNTLSRLSEFSLDSIVADLDTNSPILFQLFHKVGDTARNQRCVGDSSFCVEEMKAIMSLCTLLNARSNRFKGMQLLLSLMLVARGTGKQVIK